MIVLNLSGGLGNYMFEYAYCRYLSETLGDKKIVINGPFVNVALWGMRMFVLIPYYSLKNYHILDSVTYCNKIYGYFRGAFTALNYFIKRKKLLANPDLIKKENAKGYYYFPNACSYYESGPSRARRKSVVGGFHSEKFFAPVKDAIRQELKVKIKPSPENAKLITELQNCNSVCVHIRRGDYWDKKWEHIAGPQRICTDSYFKQGMSIIAEKIKDPEFYIFSNASKDIEWIKQNLHFDYPIKYVDLNNPDYEEIRLMYNCKHFIISNSTFSWWGSYLSDNPGKITVAPLPWTRVYPGKTDVYREDMTIIDVDTGEVVQNQT